VSLGVEARVTFLGRIDDDAAAMTWDATVRQLVIA